MGVSLILPAVAVICAAPASDVGAGSPLRRVLLDALRPAIVRDLEQPVQFKVERLRACGDWAFARVEPRMPDGKPIDFARTRYREAIEAGVFDGAGTYALLARVAGAWQVKAFAIGPTDVVWIHWVEEYGAPRELFE